MSEKQRAKKDHERTDKKNKAMHDRENPRMHTAEPRTQARDQSNLGEENSKGNGVKQTGRTGDGVK
jgi:hypothetical protein